eukprot:SAG22_NODE_5483_length_1006_cov_1.211687_1_plen_267_part_00
MALGRRAAARWRRGTFPCRVASRPASSSAAAIAADPAVARSEEQPLRRRPGNNTKEGGARLEVSEVLGKSTITKAAWANPLRLLTPVTAASTGAAGPAVGAVAGANWVYSTTFGGGLVGGDTITMDAAVGPGCTCALMTQASTKVYPTPAALDGAARVTRQHTNVSVGPAGLVAILPDPLTCYTDSLFEQNTAVELAEGGSVVSVDWISAGRLQRGSLAAERWAFELYDSGITVNTQPPAAGAAATAGRVGARLPGRRLPGCGRQV